MKKLIVVRSPMRISFVGGGTDIKEYYKNYGGSVFSASIDKYVYIVINQYHDKKKCVLKYSKTENINSVKDIKHPLIRNCLAMTKIWGLDIHSIADIPGGTGLGSSSAFTVSLLNALYHYKNIKFNKHDLAKKACYVEVDLLKSPVGKQDQYASSYGGINTFNFKKNGEVITKKFNNKSVINNLKKNLLLINTNTNKKNIYTLHEQRKNILKGGKYLDNLKFMNDSVEIFKNNLMKNDLKICGQILDENWRKKITLSKKINNTLIKEIYDESLKSGAYGGKICGAGGRGFLLLICPKKKHKIIKKKFSKLEFLDFNFDYFGSKRILPF
jgi:D-glycero-alpha-D-manno-heptose-7-phosphate kinase